MSLGNVKSFTLSLVESSVRKLCSMHLSRAIVSAHLRTEKPGLLIWGLETDIDGSIPCGDRILNLDLVIVTRLGRDVAALTTSRLFLKTFAGCHERLLIWLLPTGGLPQIRFQK